MKQFNHILTGIPRSGTTLTCHLLNKLPNTVALHEPMVVSLFPLFGDHLIICDQIESFFKESRESLITQKRAISKHVKGEVPDNHMAGYYLDSELRQKLAERGEILFEKELSPDFLLAIKHPSAFTAILDSLAKRFPSYAVIRNPLAVLGSWNSVPMAVEKGHAPMAERLDARLAHALAHIADKFDRQVHLLSWFYEQYDRFLPQKCIFRYEDIIASGGRSLNVISPAANRLNDRLRNKNQNPLYDKGIMELLGERLLNSDRAFWKFYSKESVETLLADWTKNATTQNSCRVMP